jgi:acetyltransferase
LRLIAVRNEPKTKEDKIIGVGRLIKVHGVNEAAFAIVVSDQWQGHGLRTHFLKLLLEIGRKEGVEVSSSQPSWNSETLYKPLL